MDKKEQNSYKKKLEKIREFQDYEDSIYNRAKEKNPKFVKPYDEKLVISGFHIEHSKFDKPIWKGMTRDKTAVEEGVKKRKESLALRKDLDEALKEYKKQFPNASKYNKESMAAIQAIKAQFGEELQLRFDNIRRKINKVKRKIQANFDLWTHFTTLTFNDNETDVLKAKKRLKKWVEKMTKLYDDFKYIYVMEFQDRGSIHFHILCSMDPGQKVPKDKFEKTIATWTHGSIDCKGVKYKYVPVKHSREAEKELEEKSVSEQVKTIWSIGRYLTSYLEKDADDVLLFGSKMYGNSEGLKEEITITDPKKIAQILHQLGVEHVSKKTYEIEIKETENTVIKDYYNMLMKNNLLP